MNASPRQLGLFSATTLVIGNMLGAGIFTTSGYSLAAIQSREWVLAAWLIGGVIAMMGAICYGALARQIPESGGEYLFLSRTIHPAAGYVGGWLSLFCGFSAPIAFAGLAFGDYTQAWFPSTSPKLVGSIAIIGFAWAQAERYRLSSPVQNGLVLLKLLLIGTFIAMAAVKIQPAQDSLNSQVTLQPFVASLVWIYLAYSGWNAAVYVAGEIKDPDTNIPRSLIIGTATVTILYLSLNAVFLYAAPIEALAGETEIAKIAAEALGGKGFAAFVTAVIDLALLTSISAMTIAGPRVYAKMANDGYLPAWFNQSEPPFKASVYLQLVIALMMMWFSGLLQLMTYLGFALGVGALLTVLGLIRLRLKDASISIPGWPWIPFGFVFSIGTITVITILESPEECFWGLITLSMGAIAWRLQRK
jgi:basic amino acid/polyamine antiporter, APA family